MKEKDKFFAIVPIHERKVFVEGEDLVKINDQVNEALKKPEEVYPFHDFRSEVTIIKGRKVTLLQQSKK